jgi:hypothetical protein
MEQYEDEPIPDFTMDMPNMERSTTSNSPIYHPDNNGQDQLEYENDH